MTETFARGDKVLIYGEIASTGPDRDGDYYVQYLDTGRYVFLRPEEMHKILAPTSPIDFGDIKVGDNLRASLTRKYSTYENTSSYLFTVTEVTEVVISGGNLFFRAADSYDFELISRPEPDPIVVNDVIPIDQVKTLRLGSVVLLPDESSEFRTVTKTGLFDPSIGQTRDWNIYRHTKGFTVKFIPEEA